MNKTAYIIDNLSRNSFHEVINLCFLMMISELYDEVIYYGEKTSVKNILTLSTKCNIHFNNVTFIEMNIHDVHIKPNSINYLFDAIRIGWLNHKCLRNVKNNSDVFYNNFLHFTPIFNHLFHRKDVKVFYLCHGEIEYFEKAKGCGVFAHIFGAYLKWLFCNTRIENNNRFILLSENMAEFLRMKVNEVNRNTIYGMDHCYIRPMRRNFSQSIDYKGVKIGIIGAVSPTRGISSLKKLLSKLTNGNIMIYAISTISEKIDSNYLKYLNKTDKRIPFDLYNKYVSEMDCYLFLYDVDSYKYTASGAMLEAIWNEKPILALNNYYFRYMFDKFGDLGYLANSVDELAKIVNSIDKSNISQYKEKFIEVKERLHPDYVKFTLKEIIQSIE